MSKSKSNKSKPKTYYIKKRSENFGKFGIVNLSDLFIRKLEFEAWFTEVKKKSLADLNSENERRYFEEFIVKFNNAELPSKKYYDIIKYQSKKLNNLLRRRKREKEKLLASSNFSLLPEGSEFVFDDEGQKEKEKRLLRELEQKKKLADAINTMNKEKAEAMKEIEFKGNLMRHLYQTGDTTAALDIHKQYFEVKKDKDKPEITPQIDDYDESQKFN